MSDVTMGRSWERS